MVKQPVVYPWLLFFGSCIMPGEIKTVNVKSWLEQIQVLIMRFKLTILMLQILSMIYITAIF